MPKISVLMPAYDADKYISMAIESVMGQSFTDWELIIVDDCSTDSTGVICDDYSAKDSRIKTYHMKKNVGISKAKNEAMSRATGDYLAFCDDDDIMEKNSLYDNIRLIEKNNAQIVRWSYKTIKVDESEKIYQIVDCNCCDGVYLTRDEIFKNYRNVHSMLSCDWTALYDRSLIDAYDIRFNETFEFGGEDTLFNIELLNYVERMVFNEKQYYNWYLRRKHSTTAKKNINFCHSMINVAIKEKEIVERNCEDNEDLWEEYSAFYRKLICDYADKLSEPEKESVRGIVDII